MAAPSMPWGHVLMTARVLGRPLIGVGEFVAFVFETLSHLPLTIRRYSRQTAVAMNNMAWGNGSIIVDGGTLSVLLILGLALGASIAIEAFAILNLLGFGALSGIIGGVGAVREIGPLAAGIAFTAQAGCRMTAEIGAMRISEEIDALDALGLRPIPFVVGTRLIGGLTVVIPGYVLTLASIFFILNTIITGAYGQPGGTYSHYLGMFLTPTDMLFSVVKASVFCIAVTLIHCYYGYTASGGPEGVGRASGNAVRASLVSIMVIDFALTVALWGIQPEFVFKG